MAAAEHGDRGRRAQAYVEGRMSPAEREAAEHLLEVDGAFRLAVLTAAERLGLLPRTDLSAPEAGWEGVRRHLSSLPQMQASPERSAPADPHPLRNRMLKVWRLLRGRLPGA